MAGPAVALTYAVSGLLIFFIMRMLGEMAVARPGLGSFVEYTALGLGRWAGFATGWLYWYFWVYTVGAETVAGARLLQAAGLPGPMWAWGIFLVTALTGLNLLSVRMYGELEFWFAVIKVGTIILFITAGIAYIALDAPLAALHTLLDHGGLAPMGASGLVAAVPVVIFSMMGSEVAAIAAAESSDPAGNVARAARTVALRIVAFYVLSVGVIVAVVPWNALTPGASPFAEALQHMGFHGAGTVLSWVVITAVLSCLNSGLYITSRMLHELARKGDAPRLLAVTTRNGVPVAGILAGFLAGGLAAIAQLTLREDVFNLLASTSGDIILVVYLLIALAQIRQRRRDEAAGHPLPFRMWAFPALSYFTVGIIAALLVLLACVPDQQLTLLLSALTTAAVLLAWRLRRKTRA
jgi:GABA permease